MRTRFLNIIAAGCGLAFAVTASAQDPLARSHSVSLGGEPVSGRAMLTRPAKSGVSNMPHRLGERNPLKPPFVEVFDDYPSGSEFDQFDRYFQIINSDGDTNPSGSDRSWGYYNFNGESGGRKFSKCAYLQYPINVPKCSDWLIPRAIKFEAGKYYHVTMDASLYAENSIHSVEVKMGEYNDEAGMTIPLIPPTDIKSIYPEQIEGWFVPEFDGIYYMGIHGISDRSRAEGGYLFIDNIAIETPRSGREPAQVSDLEFVSDPDGTPATAISFIAPAAGVDGEPISGSVTVVVKRGDKTIKTFETSPGQSHEFIDKVDEAGFYTYTFTATNEAGAGSGLRVTRFVGMTAPEAPVITSISEPVTGLVSLSWEAPVTDVNGTEINPDKLVYNVFNVSSTDLDLIAPEYEDTEITWNLELPGGHQEVVMMGVSAQIGNLISTMTLSDNIFVGDPYPTPYENHFTYTGEEYVISADADEGVLWRILDDFSDPQSQDGDNSYICMVGTQPGHKGELSTGKISLEGVDNPFVSFYTYIYPDDENEVSVIAIDCSTGERKVINTYTLYNLNDIGWTRVICPLKEFAGKIIRVAIGVKILSHGYVPFDNMTVGELPEVDLSVDGVYHSGFAGPGETYEVTALIANIGADDVDAYKVNLISDGRVIDSVEGTPVKSFVKTEVTLHGQFTAVSPEMPSFVVEVVATGDSNDSNNFSEEFNITFLAPNHPVVTDLKGEENDDDVTLTWSAPDLSTAAPEESFEDFESYPAFTTDLNGFTMIDVDGGNVAGFRDFDMPVNGTPQAFWTMTSDGDYYFLYTLGNSSLFSMATVDANRRPIANDDWLVSPELYGGRQTISFSACSQTINYGYETFEVYASASTPELRNFEKIMHETAVGEYWEKFFVTLPAGTKYFAIRCTSNDCLLFTLDDITYIGKGEPRALQLTGYNVYRNGEKLNSDPVTATTFSTTRHLDTDEYFVTAVYDKGESTASNPVYLGKEGVSDITADDSAAVTEYFTLQGIRVAPGALTPGLYLMRRGNVIEKVVVR